MKKIFLIAGCLLAIASTGCSRKINVPAAVTNAFNNKFPGATEVKWEKENAKEYEAEFTLNGDNVSANFGADGTWVETETVIKVADLPAAVVAVRRASHCPDAAVADKARTHLRRLPGGHEHRYRGAHRRQCGQPAHWPADRRGEPPGRQRHHRGDPCREGGA